jgi:predicted RNA-binding Zn-ribbon protein involved in translation (DUF1610 family)
MRGEVSAHCNACGADLAYVGEYPNMDCPVCLAESQRDEALARADRLADRAVMLKSRLAEVTRLLGIAVAPGDSLGRSLALCQALAVAEGES